ncbi:delta(3,5)-Delta(2,4)-dienoyl-CoA isomerase, mitochondrial [Euwallacea similis]|uniref:delta(3,5)-Delta(2,4)-dienoyl-CoA isomerase, mitochondrial n=1 Tax=Euwallacea similis TaxID=1736056 RepID=UPI00344F44AD
MFVGSSQIRQLFLNSSIVKNLARMSTSSLPTFQHLAVTTPKEYVFHVELNRPEKLNAMNVTLFSEIKQCFDLLSDHEDCRSVVLTGAGKLFTAGLDLQAFSQTIIPQVALVDDSARKAKIFLGTIKKFQDSMSSLEKCKKPVITAVHNGCIGAGVNIITAADIRYCTKDAYFHIKEIDVGLAADIGVLQRLPKIVGSDSLAREITYTCKKVPAEEALSLGLVSKIFDNKEEMVQGALSLAEEIAQKSPVAVQTTKASWVYSMSHTTQEGLDHVANLNQIMLQSEDLINSITAQISKSPPKFSKL